MSQIKIVTDSTAFLEKDVLERYDIEVVPLHVNFTGESILDGTIDSAAFFDKLKKSSTIPSTSQPSPGDFARIFKESIEEGKEIIAILISSGISGTVESAKTAAKMVDPSRISIIDSLSTSGGLAFLVSAAAQAAEEGKAREKIVALLEDLKNKLQVLFVPESLHYLKKGGRIGGAQALLGTILQIKPILFFSEGKIEVYEKVRTMKKALQRLADELPPASAGLQVAILTAEAEESTRMLKELVRKRLPDQPIKIYELSPVIATHVGPVVGLVFIKHTN
jgi:DegV family protein with EDD domain